MTFLDDLKNESTIGKTANGAKTYTSTLNANVDFFACAGATRYNPTVAKDIFVQAYDENKELALRNLVHLRNIRMGGLGEREAYRHAVQHLVDIKDNKATEMLMNYMGDIGRWDDLVAVMEYAQGTRMDSFVMDTGVAIISTQLKKDLLAMSKGEQISLMAKWLPNINTKKNSRRRMGYAIANKLGFEGSYGIRNYRKTISALRKHLDLVEIHLANKDYAKIDFTKLSSRALFRYRGAFQRNMPKEYAEFLEKVNKGEVTLNAKLLMPNDIIRAYNANGKYSRSIDQALETTWNSLDNTLEDIQSNAIVVADTSASMTWGDNGATPWEVAEGLAIYTAERLEGAFKGHFITFSSRPKLVQIPMNSTLLSKMRAYEQYSIVENTNLQRVFDLILKTAVKNNTPASELPSSILVISDMQFDSCQDGDTNFENIKRKYKESGYECPSVVFWNVNASGTNVPVRFNENGVALVSGYSTNILKQVLSNDLLSPVDFMLKTLSKPEYDFVKAGL